MENPLATAANVLVIDDAPGIRSVLKQALARAGHSCVGAADATEGIECARAARPDVIVLDIELPDGDGRDVMAALRKDPGMADVPVLVISGNIDHYRRMTALEAGADDVVEKPFDSVMLERKLSWMVAKRRAAADS